MEMLEEHRCFEGWQQRWRHDSSTLNCPMTFSIFLPEEIANNTTRSHAWKCSKSTAVLKAGSNAGDTTPVP